MIAAVVTLATGCVTIVQRPAPEERLVPTPSATAIAAGVESPPEATPGPTVGPTSPPSDIPTAIATAGPTPAPTPIRTDAAPPTALPSAGMTDSEACRDDAYSLSGYRWDRPLEWRFAEETVPDRYDVAIVLEIIRRSFDNVTGIFNDCGLPDRISAEAIYRGTATGSACGEADDVNLIGFGRLRGNFLAVTCPWVFDDDTYAEIDIEIDRGTDWALGDDCDDEYFLEAVITHEVGHAFGLGHVSERRHGELTMSTTGPVCDNEEASLGLGDVLGLEELYRP